MAVTKGLFVRWSLALMLGGMAGEADCYAPGWGGAPDSTPGPVTPGPGDDCDGDYYKVQPSDKCYKWYEGIDVWRDCRSKCESDHAHIATPRSTLEQQALVAILQSHTRDGYTSFSTWMDYYTAYYCRKNKNDRYVVWVDYCGIEVGPWSNWKDGEGLRLGGDSCFLLLCGRESWDKKEGCTMMSNSGKWYDVECDSTNDYLYNEFGNSPSCICEKRDSGQKLCERQVTNHYKGECSLKLH